VGGPANETEKCLRLDFSILHGPPPSPLHAVLGGFYELKPILIPQSTPLYEASVFDVGIFASRFFFETME
jgi:hypothetical protein